MQKNDKSDKQPHSLNKTLIFSLIVIIGLIVIFFWGRPNSKKTADDLTLSRQKRQDQNSTTTQNKQNQVPNQANNNQPKDDMSKLPKPKMQIDPKKEYFATLKTNMGTIKFKLYAQDTPLTVNNFVYLASKDFYQDTIFHRVIKDFMIQGGDPQGNGTGGPGYSFKDEDSSNKLVKGSLAMANSGPDTNGSQFFIVTADQTPWLDGKHTNFGQVIEGMDVVEKIENLETNSQDKPQEQVIIKEVEITTQ